MKKFIFSEGLIGPPAVLEFFDNEETCARAVDEVLDGRRLDVFMRGVNNHLFWFRRELHKIRGKDCCAVLTTPNYAYGRMVYVYANGKVADAEGLFNMMMRAISGSMGVYNKFA